MDTFNTLKAREAVDAIANHIVEYDGHETTIGALPLASVLYLLQYGFAQSLQDAKAGAAKAAKETVGDKRTALCKTLGIPADSADDVVAEAADSAKVTARLAALRDGTVGTGRTGPRMVGLDKIAWDIAVDAIKAAYGAKKIKWPVKADEIKAIVQPIFDANRDKWLDKARVRQAEQAELTAGLNINL